VGTAVSQLAALEANQAQFHQVELAAQVFTFGAGAVDYAFDGKICPGGFGDTLCGFGVFRIDGTVFPGGHKGNFATAKQLSGEISAQVFGRDMFFGLVLHGENHDHGFSAFSDIKILIPGGAEKIGSEASGGFSEMLGSPAQLRGFRALFLLRFGHRYGLMLLAEITAG